MKESLTFHVTALLPMKGHSERVPNKNLRLFWGRPLYHRVMESLLNSTHVSNVVIDTDSPSIAQDAKKNFPGLKIIDRPKSIQGDFVPMNSIIEHDLSKLGGEHFLQTHSTNPLLSSKTIDRAIEAYFEKLEDHDSLFTVTRIRTRLYWKDGKPVNHNSKKLLRTQDLPPLFEENSNLYIFSGQSFQKAGNRRIGLKPQMFEIGKMEAMDIDEETDFVLSELIFQEFFSKQSSKTRLGVTECP